MRKMRSIYGHGAALAAMAFGLHAPLEGVGLISSGPSIDFRAPKRRRTGKKYPFSSKRQNDRYARQIAAGQLNFKA
jgi:hypothetical protein